MEQERIKTTENAGTCGSESFIEDLSLGPQEKNYIDAGEIP